MVCVGPLTHVHVIHAHTTTLRDAAPLLCSMLINPAMTEWIWQVMHLIRPGWKRRNMAAGLLPTPTNGITQRAAGPLLDRCSFWGHPPTPLPHKATVCQHKSDPRGQKQRNTWPQLTRQTWRISNEYNKNTIFRYVSASSITRYKCTRWWFA